MYSSEKPLFLEIFFTIGDFYCLGPIHNMYIRVYLFLHL